MALGVQPSVSLVGSDHRDSASTSGYPAPPEFDDDYPGTRAPLPLEQLESHARELAAEHGETGGGGPRRELLARLDRNAARARAYLQERCLRRASPQAAETPSEEWLRDNHYVVRAQLLEIRRNLPRKYYQELPTLTTGRWRRYPRVYVFARDFVTHTAGRFNQESLRLFADAYQDVTPLTIGELWAIPIMLRLALVENLCGLAGQTLRARQERECRAAFAAEPAQGPRTSADACCRRPPRRRPRSSSRFFTTYATSRSRQPPHGDGCRRG